MGIVINLYERGPVYFYDRIDTKLRICFEAIRFFHETWFFPETAEIWFNAPSEALGGVLTKQVDAEDPYKATDMLCNSLRNLTFEDASKTIILFNGIWDFEKTKLAGYFSVHNSSDWKRVYGDIVISAYARGEFEDLTDILWSLTDAPSLVQEFIRILRRGIAKTKLGINQVIFSRGTMSEEAPENLMAAYLSGERRSLYGLFYRALQLSKDPKIVYKARPLATRFLLSVLDEEEIVSKRLEEAVQSSMVVEIKSKSRLYVAKDRHSFANLYKEVSEKIIKPALEKLPEEGKVKEWIEIGLKEYSE